MTSNKRWNSDYTVIHYIIIGYAQLDGIHALVFIAYLVAKFRAYF